MRALLILPLLLLLAACQDGPQMRPVLEGMGGPASAFRPAGPPATVLRDGTASATMLPFRQANGPGRATVSLLEGRLRPEARAVDAPAFAQVFDSMLDGVRSAADRAGEPLQWRRAATVSRQGEALLRCGEVLHEKPDGPPLALWCAGVVAERLAVIHVRTGDTAPDITAAMEFAGQSLVALRRSAERAGPEATPRPAPPAEYRTRGPDLRT